MEILYNILIGCGCIIAISFTVAISSWLGGFTFGQVLDILKVIKYRKRVLTIPEDTNNE